MSVAISATQVRRVVVAQPRPAQHRAPWRWMQPLGLPPPRLISSPWSTRSAATSKPPTALQQRRCQRWLQSLPALRQRTQLPPLSPTPRQRAQPPTRLPAQSTLPSLALRGRAPTPRQRAQPPIGLTRLPAQSPLPSQQTPQAPTTRSRSRLLPLPPGLASVTLGQWHLVLVAGRMA